MDHSFILAFITIRILDIVDILLVAFLLYQIYMLIRGTVAINIFMGIFLLYIIWLVVRALNMELLSSILGQIIGVGVIALIIVFQQEILVADNPGLAEPVCIKACLPEKYSNFCY